MGSTCSKKASREAQSVRSQMPCTAPPPSVSASLRAMSGFRPAMVTRSPRATLARAISNPRPLVPPTMTMCCSLRARPDITPP